MALYTNGMRPSIEEEPGFGGQGSLGGEGV
jgi:hypothetical protein